MLVSLIEIKWLTSFLLCSLYLVQQQSIQESVQDYISHQQSLRELFTFLDPICLSVVRVYMLNGAIFLRSVILQHMLMHVSVASTCSLKNFLKKNVWARRCCPQVHECIQEIHVEKISSAFLLDTVDLFIPDIVQAALQEVRFE